MDGADDPQNVLPVALDAGQMLATANIAQAGQRNWAINLHNTLADEGIYLAINLMIGTEAPEGVPFCAPDEIALDYWNVHTSRTQAEHCIGAWDSGQTPAGVATRQYPEQQQAPGPRPGPCL
ncbi:hypothetical protein [Streptomyces sp. NPDC056192]|uniref:hypothetical protein n=1 Tax=Streptomyces sp. NPDC056192 TaxID=3345743 RepID=UPI0035E181ED